MYAYRYRHLKKKKINGAVWLGGLLLAVIGILLQTNRSFFAKLGEEGAKSCCEKVLDFYLPGLSYSVKDETEWSFVEKVIDVLFSGENYEPESGSYQTQIESDLSYEAILAREAADENYVDENTLNVYIRRLRQKLEKDPKNPEYIITVFGIGYTFGDE